MFLDRFTHKPIIIAEAGVNHNGKAELAFELVRIAANAGADLVKFQTFKAYECASAFSICAQYQKNSGSQLDLLRELELDFDTFARLKSYAQKLKIDFISTPDGSESLDFLCKIGVDAIKVSSGELNNLPFLTDIGVKKLPVILSTGMGTIGEVQKAIHCLQSAGCPDLMLLHCTSEYPAPPEQINLKAIKTLDCAFGLPVGLSDHSKGVEAAIAATAMGAQIIEKHITPDSSLPGPDHAASMNPQEFTQLVKSVRKTALMLGSPIKGTEPCESKNKPLVRRGLVAAKAIRAGSMLTAELVAIKRPASGIAPELFEQAFNRKIIKDLAADEPISWNHLGEVMRPEL